MTQPYTDADVELVAAAIWSDDWPDGEDWATAGASEPEYRQNARAALSALAAAGRLTPAHAETVWQYAMPDPDEGPDAVVAFEGKPRHISPKWLRRPLRAVGPWLPVPDEHGNRVDDCGRCTLVPSVSGWARMRQVDCPQHGSRPDTEEDTE